MTTNGTVFESINPSGKKVWKVEIVAGRRADGTKRTVRRTAHSKREAERLRFTMLKELEEGLLQERKFTRVNDFALWWIRDVKARLLKPATASDYESRYRGYIAPTFGNRRLDSVTAMDITEWLNDMKLAGLSDATQNGALQILKMILKAAHSHGEIKADPAKEIPRLKHTRSKFVRAPWTKEEARRAIQLVAGTELELPLIFALHLGLRIGEILALKWSDIDFETGILTIQRSIREVPEFSQDGTSQFVLVESSPKTLAGIREVALTYGLQSALLTQRERLQNKGLFSTEGWIHAAKSKYPTRPNRLARIYKQFLQNHELRYIRFHDLRHSAATLGLEAGARIESVSQTLGHASIDITKRIYAPKVRALSREHSEAIQAFLEHNQKTLPSAEERSKK